MPATLLALAWLGGCAEPPEATHRTRLDPVEHLVRASLSLRGIRPTPAELDAVRARPDALDGLVDAWLASPELAETVRDLHAEQWLVRTDHITFSRPPPLGPLLGYERADIGNAVEEAPLRLAEAVVTEGRPYTDIVTADETWADPIVAAAYGLERDPDGPEWQASRWTDGRPAAGILSSTTLWQRHMSSDTNHHRARANFVAGKLLCEDFLDRDVAVGVADLDDPFAAEDRVRSDSACQSCHAALDPMASAFFGFRRYLLRSEIGEAHFAECPPELDHACYPLGMWAPELVDDREALGMPEPAFYGTPVGDLADLGRQIAADPRFATCTARRFYSWMTQVPPDDVPFEIESELAAVLVQSGWDARELMRAVVMHDSFTRLDGPVPVQLLRPEAWARTVEHLTGHALIGDPSVPGCEAEWYGCNGPVDMVTTDKYGFRALMGGVDGWDVTLPTHTPSPSAVLAWSWLAEEAAGVVVDHDLSGPVETRRLLHDVDADTTDEGAIRDQLAALHWRILAEDAAPHGPVVDATWWLWRDVHARSGDPSHAWQVVIATLLQDSRMVMY